MRPRPGRYAGDLCTLCAQQRPRHGHCARSVRATWVLDVRIVHPTQFYDSALFRGHCLDTVHEHCS